MNISYSKLRELYIDSNLTTAEVGTILGVSQTKAYDILRSHNLIVEKKLCRATKQRVHKEKRLAMSKKDCAECQYRGYDANLGGLYCNYFEVTGRIRPCPGKACTEYIKGPRKRSIFIELH